MDFQPFTLPNKSTGFQPFTTGNQKSTNPGYVAPKQVTQPVKQVQAPAKGFQIGDVIKQGEDVAGGVIKAAENIFKPISLPNGLSLNLIGGTPLGVNQPLTQTKSTSNDFPQTTKDIKDLGIDPLNLKADPTKAINDAWNSITTSFNQEKKNIKDFFDAKTTSKKVGTGLTATAGAANVVFSPLTALFAGANRIPVLGSVAKLVTLPFTVASEGASALSGRIVDELPVSNQTKTDIKAGVQQISELAAQLVLGKVMSPQERGALIDKFGTDDAMTIENKAQDLANQQKNQLKMGENKPEDVVNHIVNNDLMGTPEGQKMMKAALEAQNTGKNVFISETPVRQQLSDLQSIKTPDDAVLNPIIDQVNGIINENENNQGIQNSENSNIQTTENQSIQGGGEIKQNSNQPEVSSSIQGQGSENTKPSTESIPTGSTETIGSGNTGSESVKSTGGSSEPSGKAVSKLTSSIEDRLNTEFKDIPGYEKMNMKDQANKAVDLILKQPDLAKAIAMGEKSAPSGLEAGSVFTAVREKAFSEGDVQTLHDLAKTDLAGKAGQALKAYDTFSDDPVKTIKDIIDSRTKAIEEKAGKSLSEIQKDNASKIETEVKKSVAKVATKAKLADFIKSIQCN